MKTSELTGRALDWAVWSTQVDSKNIQPRAGYTLNVPRFSTDWSLCGKLIEKYQIFIDPPHEVHKSMVDSNGKPKGCWESYDTWHATVSSRVAQKPSKYISGLELPGGVYRGEGETPLIAICRAVVYMLLGDNVNIPSGVVIK